MSPSRGGGRRRDQPLEGAGPRRNGPGLAAMRQQFAQSDPRGVIGDAVDPLGPEMALESGDRIVGGGIVIAVHGHPVAVFAELLLHRRYRLTAVAQRQELAALGDRRWLDPMADRGIVERAPGKFSPGSCLRDGATSEW